MFTDWSKALEKQGTILDSSRHRFNTIMTITGTVLYTPMGSVVMWSEWNPLIFKTYLLCTFFYICSLFTGMTLKDKNPDGVWPLSACFYIAFIHQTWILHYTHLAINYFIAANSLFIAGLMVMGELSKAHVYSFVSMISLSLVSLFIVPSDFPVVALVLGYFPLIIWSYISAMARIQMMEHLSMTVASSKMSSLGEMAAGIAHEINNPLMVISTGIESLRKFEPQIAENKDRYIKILENLNKMVHRTAGIIRSMKNLSRDGSRDPIESVLLRDLVEDSVSLCAQRFIGKDIALEIKIPEEPVYVMCRTVHMSQVMVNLLNNAYDAVKELNSKWIRIEAKINPQTQLVDISVVDSGSGVPKDIQDKIFQPFFTTKPIGVGTGLGLSISRTLLKNQNASLSLDTASKNTCFVISMPRSAA